ncbi:MAG: phage holin family protein [Chitinophagales bacterium]|nr:phage holin family protein [Chitinophagales bacterium]
MKFLGKLLINTVAIMITAYLLHGIHVEDPWRAFLVAVLLAVLNVTLKPLLIILTIPITILTLGLFLLAINAIIILIAGNIIPGFTVDGFWWALLFSILMSVINSMLEYFIKPTVRRQDQQQF